MLHVPSRIALRAFVFLPLTLMPQTTILAGQPVQVAPQPPARTQPIKGNPVTRDKVAQMLYDAFKTTLFKNERPKQETVFQDVPHDNSSFTAIAILSQHNILGGNAQGNFDPQGPLSRYELATAFDTLIQELKLTGLPQRLTLALEMPRDIPKDAPAYEAVERMLKLEVLLPFDDSYFRGKRATTDAEVADGLTCIKELTKTLKPAERASEDKSGRRPL